VPADTIAAAALVNHDAELTYVFFRAVIDATTQPYTGIILGFKLQVCFRRGGQKYFVFWKPAPTSTGAPPPPPLPRTVQPAPARRRAQRRAPTRPDAPRPLAGLKKYDSTNRGPTSLHHFFDL